MVFVYVSEIGIDDIESGAGTKPRFDVRIDIVPDSELVEGRVLDNTLLIVPIHTEEMRDLVGTAGNRKIIVLETACLSYGILPICAFTTAQEQELFGGPCIALT